jgi:hypothetical protein
MDIASTAPKFSSPLRANHSAADLLVHSPSPTLRPQLTRSQSNHSRNSSASSANSVIHSPNPSTLRHTVQAPISIYQHQEADIGETTVGYSTSYTPPQYNHLPASHCHSEPNLSPNLNSEAQHSPSESYCTTASFSDEEEVSSLTSSSDVFGVGTMLEADKDITELIDSKKINNLTPDVLAKFRQWMVGFCVVNFDLEIGQGIHTQEQTLFFNSTVAS